MKEIVNCTIQVEAQTGLRSEIPSTGAGEVVVKYCIHPVTPVRYVDIRANKNLFCLKRCPRRVVGNNEQPLEYVE